MFDQICFLTKGWFAVNNLTFNADKSAVMLIGTSAQLRAVDRISDIVVAGANLKPVAVIKSLGIILDSLLTFAAHVTAVSKACKIPHMGLIFSNARRRQHFSLQHRWSTHWLLQLILVRCMNVVDNQAATSAELVGSCRVLATKTNSCRAPSAATSAAVRRTSDDL